MASKKTKQKPEKQKQRDIVDRIADGVSAGFERLGEGVSDAFSTFLHTFKDQDPHYPFKMLLIGETGAGKTSFLNLLYNCSTVQALGCGFGKEGLKRIEKFNDIRLENALSMPMASKTNVATLYNVEVGKLKVGIIDSPGFGDSRGFEQDEKNAQRIIDTLKQEDYINCVCLIINGSQSRASASLQYVLTEITAILPTDIFNNVIVVFTNTIDVFSLNFDSSVLTEYFGTKMNSKHIFCIENPYCRFERAKTMVDQLGNDLVVKSLRKSFEDTSQVLTDICLTIKDFPQVHTLRFIELYEKKKTIESSVLAALTAYDNQMLLEKALRDAKEKIDVAIRSKTLNKDFRSEQRFTVWIQPQTKHHNTLCGYKGCHSNCHVGCGLSKSLDKNTFKSCLCMGSNDYCEKCGHYYTYHYHEETLFEEREEVKSLLDKRMQKKFEMAKSNEERAQMLYNQLEKDMEGSKKKREQLSVQLLSNITEFEKMGAVRSYAKLIENQLAVIETHLKGTDGAKAADLRKTKIEMEKKLKLIRDAKSES